MLDENLPTFFLKSSPDGVKHHESFYFTQYGSEPEATYALKHADPASNEAKNTYAAALFDSHNPDILYGEVLAKPGWTQPSLSQEEIRKNGGVPPPPDPIFPTEFAIQLYSPDQRVLVKQHTSKWSGTVSYEFSMPITTFRTPSSSSLDRSQGDPSADETTPKVNFVWRKEGRIGKDMTCYLTGKSTDPTGKKAKKHKEPDITVALFSGLKEMTIMESNMYRVEIEDSKGLEVVLLLGAAVIRDLFFGNARDSFHIVDPNGSSSLEASNITPPVMTPQPPPPPQRVAQPMKGAALTRLYAQPSPNDAKRNNLPLLKTGNQPTQRLDPRAQWEIDAETVRLRAQAEAEAREQKRQEEMSRRARRKAEEEEERKTRERKQAKIDEETERLRRQFGDQSNLLPPSQPHQRHSAPLLQGPFQRPSHAPAQPLRPANQGPYLQLPGGHRPTASQSTFFSNGLPKPDGQAKKKKSFWGLRSNGEQNPTTLRKKQSSMF
ncbi:hypothetical protein CC78DRAFT_479606 [Lojkania enalia]|uniref:Uncharacterized protein n=1 Tax=Lojkania enalia TaxID=147567 RepID=A0A9P4N4D1_9PLEO|nr:hypothetical protein CC78DRAFT_479606 [Didymosphaeria enalia]